MTNIDERGIGDMKALFKNALYYSEGGISVCNMLLSDTTLSVFMGDVSTVDCPVFENIAVFPGFFDVHVHLREPGFSYKETIRSGTRASARGGFTAVLSMPNLKPTPDSVEHLKEQLDIIERDAVIKVIPYGTITVGEAGETLSDMQGMAGDVAGYSDDGRGVQNEEMMKRAMEIARSLDKPIVAHCEDNSLLYGGYIHDGEYARAHGHKGICSESEWGPIKRDIELIKETGVKYHVCHISTKESVELIRRAKAEGVDITCETGPHYLLLDDSDLKEEGRFKMNPPIRSREDREALVEGLLDGTVDMVATDHAPHSEEEKSKGLAGSLMGVVGIETSFPLLYTYLVKTGKMSLETLVMRMSVAPRKRFGIEGDAGFTVFKVDEESVIDPDEFLSAGKSSPFTGTAVSAKCILTVYNGHAVYSDIV